MHFLENLPKLDLLGLLVCYLLVHLIVHEKNITIIVIFFKLIGPNALDTSYFVLYIGLCVKKSKRSVRNV